jgi:hypothetical protein
MNTKLSVFSKLAYILILFLPKYLGVLMELDKLI